MYPGTLWHLLTICSHQEGAIRCQLKAGYKYSQSTDKAQSASMGSVQMLPCDLPKALTRKRISGQCSFSLDLTWYFLAIHDVCWWCGSLILEAACPYNNNNNGFGTWILLNVSVFPVGALRSDSMAYLSLLRSRTKPEFTKTCSEYLPSDLLTCSISSPDSTPNFWTTAEIKQTL